MTTPVEAQGMPPLPDGIWQAISPEDFTEAGRSAVESAIQTYARSYAAAQVAEERERCAKVVEEFPHWLGKQGRKEIAAAIRATTQEGMK